MDLHSWHKWNSAGLLFYKAWNLDKSGLVTHGFTTRLGGESLPPYDSLNLGLHVGDDQKTVIANRIQALEALSLDPSSLTTAEQIHGSRVAVVTEDNAGLGAADLSTAIPGVDALITNTPGLPLCLFFADCVPVFILDPINKAIGLAHAGWKGTAAGIVKEMLNAMEREFGTKPQNCQAAIGPAIGRCCYEVGPDVAQAIYKVCVDQRPIARGSEGKFKVDLQVANWCLLRQTGVSEDSIAVCMHCTCCHADEFFSYRRDGETGRMMAIMVLRE